MGNSDSSGKGHCGFNYDRDRIICRDDEKCREQAKKDAKRCYNAPGPGSGVSAGDQQSNATVGSSNGHQAPSSSSSSTSTNSSSSNMWATQYRSGNKGR